MNTCPHCPTSHQKVQFIKQREFVPADIGWAVIDLKKRREMPSSKRLFLLQKFSHHGMHELNGKSYFSPAFLSKQIRVTMEVTSVQNL